MSPKKNIQEEYAAAEGAESMASTVTTQLMLYMPALVDKQ